MDKKIIDDLRNQIKQLQSALAESQAREKWFDNLVEYKIKGKFQSLRKYVEHLETTLAEKEKEIEDLKNKLALFPRKGVILTQSEYDQAKNALEVLADKDQRIKELEKELKNYTGCKIGEVNR